MISGAVMGLSGTELTVELRQMIHHKGSRRIPETAPGEATNSADSLSYHVVSAALEVHKQLGPGLLESAYEACLCRELGLRGIAFQSQVALPIDYRDISLDCDFNVSALRLGIYRIVQD